MVHDSRRIEHDLLSREQFDDILRPENLTSSVATGTGVSCS